MSGRAEGQPAVLLCAFGGPESLGEVDAFVASVLGRTPPEALLAEVRHRYARLGGGSPLPATTRAQAQALERRLADEGCPCPVRVGMLHSAPTLADALSELAAEGIGDLVVLSLAPYRSQASTTAYERAVTLAAQGAGFEGRLRFPADWFAHPTFVACLGELLDETLAAVPEALRPGLPVVFSAHSIPERFVQAGDPYPGQLAATAAKLAADRPHIAPYQAYQSVSGAAREPWLGPAVERVLADLAAGGARAVLVDPIGFVSDHLETLYDNDIVHREEARRLGLDFYRCPCPNLHPLFIRALAEIVLETMGR